MRPPQRVRVDYLTPSLYHCRYVYEEEELQCEELKLTSLLPLVSRVLTKVKPS